VPRSKRKAQGVGRSIQSANCPSCGASHEYKKVVVVMPGHRLRKLRCDACRVRLTLRTSKADGEVRVATGFARGLPGLIVFLCSDCAEHCDDCRYEFEEDSQ